jgi:ABC-type antimicrobial peptide transport system permease subunit
VGRQARRAQNRSNIAAAQDLFGACDAQQIGKAFTVAQREREIGVRMALGADVIRIARLVFGRVSRMVIAGVIAGCAAAVGLGNLAQSMLFGVEGPAPLVMADAAIGVTAIALSAAASPARRTVWVDPAVTLRAE